MKHKYTLSIINIIYFINIVIELTRLFSIRLLSAVCIIFFRVGKGNMLEYIVNVFFKNKN